MSAIKIVAISVVVVAIIHRGIANDRCESILGQEFELHDGFYNFKHSYSNLSVPKINQIYKEPYNAETNEEKSQRMLTKELTLDYFHEIFTGTKIDFKDIYRPVDWCKYNRSESVLAAFEEISIPDVITHACIAFVRMLGVPMEKRIDKYRVLKVLYENWSTDAFNDYRNVLGLSNYDQTNEQYVQLFSYGYFDYIEEAVRNATKARELIQTVFAYCQNKGQNIVEKHENMLRNWQSNTSY